VAARERRRARPPADAALPAEEGGRVRPALWSGAALVAAAVAMGLEMAAARLLAPYLGSSLQVWGCLISVVLGAMALGYALGGRAADRWPGDGVVFGAILAAGVCQVAALLAAHPLLRRLAPWSEGEAAVAAMVVLFAPPTLLLSTAGPGVIRLLARQSVGSTAGVVYALGAVGSIAGVLLTSFVLLPQWGTRATLQGLAATTLALGVAGLLPRRAAAVVGGLAAVALPAASERVYPARTVWVGESPYHVVQVVDVGRLRGLVLDQEDALHTAIDPQGGPTGRYWDDFAVGPLLAKGHRVLVLGMGAGASVRAVRSADPLADIDAVEIDPVVTRVAREQFGIVPGPRLRVHVDDARRFLAAAGDDYDVVQADLFRGGPDIPSHLVTEEFFGLVRRRLRPGGVAMVNVFDVAPEHPVLVSVAATLARVFPSVFVRSRSGMNHVLVAFAEARGESEVHAALAPAPKAAADVAADFSRELRPLPAVPDALVLTDDRAPIEALTRRMMADARAAGVLRAP
jgi:predicted membrane-bound spermidine synthase